MKMPADTKTLKRFLPIVAITLATTLTLASGFIQGQLDERFGRSEEMLAAASALQALPIPCGVWEFQTPEEDRHVEAYPNERDLGERVVDILQCAGYINRRYQDPSSGETVDVTVLIGPPPETSVHKPSICLPSRAYKPLGDARPVVIEDSQGVEHKVWCQTFRPAEIGQASLRMYWGWSTGNRWDASESPRTEFMGEPYLYKIQLGCSVARSAENEEDDSCRRFMREFMTQVGHHMTDSKD